MSGLGFWGELWLLLGGGAAVGVIARLAANGWREGMGIGLFEPIWLLFVQPPVDDSQEEKDRAPPWPPASLAAILLMAASVAAFFALALFFPQDQRLWLMGFTALMLIASAVDQKHYFIPDPIVFLLLALGLARCFDFNGLLLLETDIVLLQEAVLGFLAAYGFSVLLQSLFDVLGRQAFFWGDLKYALALGVWMGFPAIIWMLLLASLLGLAYSLISRRGYFPFAPFLSVAAFTLLFTRDAVSAFLTNLLI